MKEEEIGIVSNYFSKLSVAAVEITDGTLSVGDTLHITGSTTDLIIKVDSMQVEHESVPQVKKGDSVGLKMSGQVRKKDKVFKVIEE